MALQKKTKNKKQRGENKNSLKDSCPAEKKKKKQGNHHLVLFLITKYSKIAFIDDSSVIITLIYGKETTKNIYVYFRMYMPCVCVCVYVY